MASPWLLLILSSILPDFTLAGHAQEHVVYPRLLEERGINGEKLVHIKEGLTLRLEESSALGKNFIFTERKGNNITQRNINVKEVEKDLYQDKHQMAAVSVEEKDGGVEIGGILSPTLRIAPLPFMRRSQDGAIAHKLFEVQVHGDYSQDYTVQPDALPEVRARQNYYYYYRPRSTPPPVTIPDVFEVEVKIISDKEHHKHFRNRTHLIRYFSLLITAMTLRYQEVTSPKVTFRLVEVEMNTDDYYSGTVYGKDPIQPKGPQKRFLSADTTIPQIANSHLSSTADMVVLITGMDLATVSSGVVSPSVLGRAYVGGVCSARFKAAAVEDVALTYSGVGTLSHELGHALGMPHDGSPPQWKNTRVHWTQCQASDGYEMAPSADGKNSGVFSVCSISAFRAFVATLSAECFRIKSESISTTDTKILPGSTMNATFLCQRLYSTYKNVYAVRDRQYTPKCMIKCCIPALGYCYLRNMPDGMLCQQSQTCLRGRCGYHTRRQSSQPSAPVLPPTSKNLTTPGTTPTTTTLPPRTTRTARTQRPWTIYNRTYPPYVTYRPRYHTVIIYRRYTQRPYLYPPRVYPTPRRSTHVHQNWPAP